MTEGPRPDPESAPSTWAMRLRSKVANAGGAARRRMERLPGRTRASTVAGAAPDGTSSAIDVERLRAELAEADAAAQGTVNRTRIVIAIVGVVVQVAIALIAWRLAVWRRHRRGPRIHL